MQSRPTTTALICADSAQHSACNNVSKFRVARFAMAKSAEYLVQRAGKFASNRLSKIEIFLVLRLTFILNTIAHRQAK